MTDTDRCPSCGATVAAGASWCSLCLAPLAGPEESAAAPPVTPPAAPSPIDPRMLPPPQGAAVRPQATRSAAAPDLPPPAATSPILPPPPDWRTRPPAISPDVGPGSVAGALPADPDAWVALLAEEERRSAPAVLGVATSRSQRVVIMIGGAFAIITVLAVAMVLLSVVAG